MIGGRKNESDITGKKDLRLQQRLLNHELPHILLALTYYTTYTTAQHTQMAPEDGGGTRKTCVEEEFKQTFYAEEKSGCGSVWRQALRKRVLTSLSSSISARVSFFISQKPRGRCCRCYWCLRPKSPVSVDPLHHWNRLRHSSPCLESRQHMREKHWWWTLTGNASQTASITFGDVKGVELYGPEGMLGQRYKDQAW